MNRREVRVFISSTFSDMFDEREVLMKKIFPELRSLLSSRRLSFFEVDLRWGVTEKQASRGEVLPICLSEIDSCRPYFIGLLGERYGWIPEEIPDDSMDSYPWLTEYEGRSMTELEIVHGVIKNPHMAAQSFFYFRDPAYIDGLPVEERQKFRSENAEEQKRLKELKLKITESGLPVRENYQNPQELGELVLADLKEAINREFPEGDTLSAFDEELLEHEIFREERAAQFVGREGELQLLTDHAATSNPPLVVTGDLGIGKTALLASWATRYGEAHPEIPILTHFVGASAESADALVIIKKILGWLKRHFSIKAEIPQLQKEVLQTLSLWLDMAARKGRMVLVFDGLEELSEQYPGPGLSWLPREYPDNVRVILSVGKGEGLSDLISRGYSPFELPPLNREDVKRVSEDYLGRYRKTLATSQAAPILDAPRARNPLYLRVLLEELRLYGVYEGVTQQIEQYLKARDPTELFRLLLSRLEADFENDRPRLVGDVLSLIAASRHGLTETEIVEILSLPRIVWSRFYYSIKEFLTSTRGMLRFSYTSFHEAVEDSYLCDENTAKAVHRCLAEYIEAHGSHVHKLGEYCWQLIRAEDWDRLKDSLTDLQFLNELWMASEVEVIRLWNALEQRGGIRIVEAFEELFKNPDKIRPYQETLYNLFLQTGHLAEASRIAELPAAGALEAGRTISAKQKSLLGIVYLDQNKPGEALPLLQDVAEDYRDLLGDGNIWVAASLSNLAAAKRMQGEVEDPIRLYLEALKVFDDTFGENNPQSREALQGMGVAYYTGKDYLRAIQCFEKALAVGLYIHGSSHPDVAISYNDLANSHGFLKHYDKAVECHEKALEIRRAVYGGRHPLVADSLYNLGNILDLQDKHEEASHHHREALSIRIECLGASHPEVHKSRGMMAGVAQRWLKALEGDTKNRKRRDGFMAHNYHLIGVLLMENGQFSDAEQAFKKAFKNKDRLLTRKQQQTGDVLTDLGDLSERAGEREAAIHYYNQALELQNDTYGSGNLTAVDLIEIIGIIYRVLGKFEMSEDYLKRTYTLRLKMNGPSHPLVGRALNNLGGLYFRHGKYVLAADYFGRALQNTETVRDTKHVETAAAYGNRGMALNKLGRVDEAITHLHTSWDIYSELLGSDDPRTQTALKWLQQAEIQVGHQPTQPPPERAGD